MRQPPAPPQTCTTHEGEVLVPWKLRGRGKPPVLVCLKCEEPRKRRIDRL